MTMMIQRKKNWDVVWSLFLLALTLNSPHLPGTGLRLSSLCQSGKWYFKGSPNEALSGVLSQNKQHYVGHLD